jgi:hypothetical protein
MEDPTISQILIAVCVIVGMYYVVTVHLMGKIPGHDKKEKDGSKENSFDETLLFLIDG